MNRKSEATRRAAGVADAVAKVLPYALPAVAAALLLTSAATDTWGTYDVQIQADGRECAAQWCQPGQVVRDAEASVAAQVAELTAGRDCWTGQRDQVPGSLVVHAVGSTDVKVMSFASGFKAAEAGRVWVDASCA